MQNQITAFKTEYGKTLARVVYESGDKVKLVSHGFIEKSKLVPPLEVGEQVIYRGMTVTVTRVDDDRVIIPSSSKWYYENNGTERSAHYVSCMDIYFSYVNDNKIVDESETYKKACELLEDASWDYNPAVLSRTVKQAYSAKSELREKFRKSEFWNEDKQALIVPGFTFTSPPDIGLAIEKLSNFCIPYNLYELLKKCIRSYIYKGGIYLNDYTADALSRCELTSGHYFDHYHHGQKVTRFLRNILTENGNAETDTNFERKFAELSDSLSEIKNKRTLVISLNILDFLTMSYGNSWSSCHNIKEHGCYCGGTLSYALDKTSAILFTIDPESDLSGYLCDCKKINRQIFAFTNDAVLCSRLYPSCEATDIRKAHVSKVKDIWEKITENKYSVITAENQSTVQRIVGSKITTVGNHYPDYTYAQYNTAILKLESLNDSDISCFAIGAEAPDLMTGHINADHEVLSSGLHGILPFECERDGDIITDEEYLVEYNGSYYHKDNCDWCDYEEIYVPCGEAINIGDNYYSQEYVDENFIVCEECGEYERIDNAIIDADGNYYCDYCAGKYLTRCEECGEYHRTEDMTYLEDEDMCLCEHCTESCTEKCSVCGTLRYKTYLTNGVCEDCIDETDDTFLQVDKQTTVLVKNGHEIKTLLKSLSEYHWIDGSEGNSADMRSVLTRTINNPYVNSIGISINAEGVMSYYFTTSELKAPEVAKYPVINFADLTLVNKGDN